MRLKTIAALILPTAILAGCGGGTVVDERREASGSSNLTGLWRLNLEASQTGLSAEANATFTLLDQGSTVSMVSCADRETVTLSRNGSTLSGLPTGESSIVNNDTFTASNNLGDSVATKMDTSATFDMGSFTVSGGDLGSISSSNICVQSDNAAILGVTNLDHIYAITLLDGEILTIDITRTSNLSTGTFDVNTDMSNGGVQISMSSPALVDRVSRREMDLRDGTITITKDNDVWFNGNFSANMPNGQTVSGSFVWEKP